MRMDQFTVKAQEAIAAAQTQAEKSDHPEVTPEHLLRAMVDQESGVVPAALGKMGVPTAPILQDLDRALGALPRTQGAATQISPKLDGVLKGALREAEALKDQYVSTEHLLLALVEARTVAGEILKRHGVARDRVLTVLREIRGNQSASARAPAARRWSARRAASSPRRWARWASTPAPSLQDLERALGALPRTQGAATQISPKLDAVLKGALREAEALKDQYVSTEHLLLALVEAKTVAAEILKRHGVTRDRVLHRAARDPRQPARRRSQRRGPLPVPREVRPRPHRAGPQGQARPRHRPRRRGAPGGPGPLPPHQEQPRAHRRARRGQDRHRGGPRPAHRLRRRAGVAEEQEAGGPRPRARSSRGPSTAASSRTG